MPLQAVGRVIGRADQFYAVVLHQSLRAELRVIRYEVVALVVDGACSLRIQTLLDTESGLELQMCPVVQRVAESIRHGLSPFLELLPVRRILTGAVALVYTVAAHSAPLVVVTHEPDLCD